MSQTRNILVGILALSLICTWERAEARHIPELLIQELYKEITTPACLYSNRVDGTSYDCENPDPAVFECWKKSLHWDYDEESVLAFLEEVKASNQNYEFYNATTYNEFFSNRNWDNILYYAAIC